MVLHMIVCLFAIQVRTWCIYASILLKIHYKIFCVVVFIDVY